MHTNEVADTLKQEYVVTAVTQAPSLQIVALHGTKDTSSA